MLLQSVLAGSEVSLPSGFAAGEVSVAEDVALLGVAALQGCESRVNVENSVSYVSQTHKCLNMSAGDIPASGRVIVWFALGKGPVPTHRVLRKDPSTF